MIIDSRFLKKIPHQPGVYFFMKKNKILYVGKAKDLKKRVATYRRAEGKTKIMINQATQLKVLPLKNELIAFFKEAELIKKYQPPFNTILRDDTNYFYVGVTQEKIPKVFITHTPLKENINYFGPFVEGKTLKLILKKIRKFIPFCTCLKPHLRDCLNAQLGLCFGWCCRLKSEFDKITYQKNINLLKLILKGKLAQAQKIKPELEMIFQEIKQDFFLNIDFNPYTLKAINELKNLLKLKDIKRIEAYDISHWLMTFPYGVMIVWDSQKNDFNKNEYRVFKIKTVSQPDDPRMLAEIIERRLHHLEWPLPQVIILDGGQVQFKMVKQVLTKFNFKIKLTSLAKGRMEFLYDNFKLPLSSLPFHLANFIKKINQEAHRFALAFHRKIRHRRFVDEKLKLA